jgi:hypothetical protein
VATAVVGAFDAVLLVAVPTFFVWTLAGALAPPAEQTHTGWAGVREFAPMVLLGLAALGVGRSAFQLAAIGVFSTSSKTAAWEQASIFDPGSYRIHTRLAQAYIARGDCKRARPHAQAARGLLPNAAEPRRELNSCGK